MTARQRSRVLMGLALAGLMFAMVTSAGCNILSLPFFIFGPEPRIEASLKKLADEDKKKLVRVVILASDLNPNADCIRADRDLSNWVVVKLKEFCKANGENIEVVAPPRWRSSSTAATPNGKP